MGLISRANDYVRRCFALQKTQQRRDKPFKPPTAGKRTPLETALKVRELREQRDRLSPEPSDASNPSDTPPYRSLHDGTHHAAETDSDAPQPSVERTQTEPDGDTPQVSVERTPAKTNSRFSTPSTGASRRPVVPDDFDANESVLVMTEHDYANERLEHSQVLDVEAELEYLHNKRLELEEQGWANDAILLFMKLEARGKEPLLPKSWEMQFQTLPAALFTPDGSVAHISSMMGEAGDFRASRALNELILLAPRVRDAVYARKAPSGRKAKKPEMVTKKAIAEYLKWAYADAKLSVASPSSRRSLDSALAEGKSLPLLITVAGSRAMTGKELEAVTLEKLVQLGELWKDALTDPETGELITELPTLYAVITTYTIFGLVSYDIDFVNEDGEMEAPFVRNVALFDFSKKGTDVWNSLAIALLGVHVRNEMADIRKDIEAFKGEELAVGTEDDVDA